MTTLPKGKQYTVLKLNGKWVAAELQHVTAENRANGQAPYPEMSLLEAAQLSGSLNWTERVPDAEVYLEDMMWRDSCLKDPVAIVWQIDRYAEIHKSYSFEMQGIE